MTKLVSAAAFASPAPSLFSDSGTLAQNLVEAYLAVRNETERRAGPLSPEDQLIQSMPDASPAKWHRAHTTWFFEQFLLGEHCEGYQPFHPDYAFLFNSYYVSAGPRHARHQRGHLTRPSADEVSAYRRHVDAAVVKFFQTTDEERLAKLAPLVEVGLNHEQQHQELMLTDILHAFAQNPIPPAYDPAWRFPASQRSAEEWVTLNEGIHTVGHADGSFHFDNEKPAHRALVGPVRLARNLVTNAEWLAFMTDGGYGTATLWLMDGFATATNEGWQAPGHWRQVDGEWRIMTLGGLQPIDPSGPGQPCQLLRGRRVRALGRPASSDRDGVGGRRPRRPVERRLRHRLAVDPQLLFALPRLPRRRGRAWGVQRQVHGQPAGAARLLACNSGRPQPYHLPQLLLSAPPLAIYGVTPR